ncbi:MAG: pectate lyase [Bacteroidota bacterium]
MRFRNIIICTLLLLDTVSILAQKNPAKNEAIDIAGFYDSAHHWYDINDEVPKTIMPEKDQKKYSKDQIEAIADNILLYQRANGGWPKNYDMLAILTDEQKKAIVDSKNDISLTTFDNGATHSQIAYLAKAFKKTKQERFKDAVLRGIDFILSAQYPNGGFPQFYPDTKGYRKYITFNDGAMGGVMEVLGDIVRSEKQYAFVDDARRASVRIAFDKGVNCILQCQINVGDSLTAWCQQHDNVTLKPQNARTFEPKAICSMESAEIVRFLMEIDAPSAEVKNAVHSAVAWFRGSALYGIRVENRKMDTTKFQYHTSTEDRVLVRDESAPQIWSRMYEIGTNRPLFCNRDGKVVYSLADVELERRTGYAWYGYGPQEVLNRYDAWCSKWNTSRIMRK